jgi:hypothetical protein
VFKVHVSVMVLCASLLGFECVQVEAMEQSAETASEPPHSTQTVTGILTTLDMSAGNGMLKTDLNKTIFFKMSRPDLFEHLSIGDRVTMQIDDEGRTMKVIKASPAEVHEPPPPSQ